MEEGSEHFLQHCDEDVTRSKEVYEVAISNQDCLNGEKYNVIQTVDLCDLTFSSFNDILLGECSYFEDISATNSSDDVVRKLVNGNQFPKSNPSNLLQGSPQSNELHYQNNLEGLNDNCSFYNVLEVIENTIEHTDGNEKLNKIQSVQCKSYKNPKNKTKRKIVTGIIRKGQRYLPNFKQKVLDYASTHTFKETALHFNINCNTITEWVREKKRLSLQQKSTTSIVDSICHYKTEVVQTPAKKTDIIITDDKFILETEFNDNILKKIEKDLPVGDMRPDERFLGWIKTKRCEQTELSRNEVFYAALYCLKGNTTNMEQPEWFALWVERYKKALQNSEKTDHETEKYIMYPNNFKLEVALYAKLFTKNSAARVFNVPRRRVFDWFKYSDPSFACNRCLDYSSASVIGNEKDIAKKDKTRRQIYAELHEWYQKKILDGLSPSSNEIKAKARDLFHYNGIDGIKFSEGWLHKFCKRLNIKLKHNCDDHLLLWILAQYDNNVSLSHQEITEKSSKLIGKQKEFKGSKGWTLRFLKRHSNFLQQVPTIDDKLPDIAQSAIDKFCSSFRYILNSRNIGMKSIGCMDEIPVSFNYPQVGKTMQLPLLRKTGFENCQAVVFLSMLADGRILPPAVLLRGNSPRQLLSDGNVDILVLYQEKGLVDFEVLECWVEYIWLSFVSAPSTLIVDSFKPHCSSELRERLAKNNCMLSIIPEGCSSQLQPLDIEVTPKFKDLIRNQWKEVPSNEVLYSSKISKSCRCPDQDSIVEWIRNAHRRIEKNTYSIMNSFKVVGLID